MAAKKSRRWLPDEDAALIAAMVDMRNAHPKAAQFRVRTFPYFSELSAIYAMDHATGKDAQTAADILEEMAQETEREAADQDAEMESNNVVQDDVGLDEMDVSTTPSIAAKLIGDGIREAGKDLSRSIGSEMVIQEKVQELDIILGEIDGLTEEERDIALSKIPDHPAQMLVFGSLPPHRKLAWVRRFLSSH
ncbi:hypothetical protein COLO4_26759 [Corchorus olitorius]|uniref:Uncharacterized protein n=1 Tax=Corchorus olitorius TaxID=93759 RepID=A0A1R3HUK7_9ROSI|nr:hypothetical protein COLO4_26759 [Corchorus olitorius]